MDLDILLDSLAQEAEYGGNYQLDSYEADEAYEIENFLVSRRGIRRGKARKMAATAVRRPAFKRPMQTAARSNGGQGIVSITGNRNTPVSAAQFDVNIKRVTANIAQDLPFVIFGQQDSKNGFRKVIDNLPTGVTLTSVEIGEVQGEPEKLIFTYTENANVDTVEVTCNQYPYPSFLEAMSTNFFRMSKLRYQLSDSAQLSQFNNDFSVTTRSMFGKRSANSISINAYKDPKQFQAGIIDVDGEFDLDKETSILSSIINVAGFEVNLAMFIEKFETKTAKNSL
jgi:hypothetical protein